MRSVWSRSRWAPIQGPDLGTEIFDRGQIWELVSILAFGLAPFGRPGHKFRDEALRTSGEASPHQARFADHWPNFNTRGFASRVALRATDPLRGS